MTTFTPVAVTYDDRLPFGPFFESEEAAWKWLHLADMDEYLVPADIKSFDVEQQT